MDASRQLTRRQVLAGMGILVFAAVPGVVRGRGFIDTDPEAALAGDRVASLFDGEAVAELGGAYLASRSDDPDAQRLLAELLPPQMTYTDVERASPAQLRAAFHDAAMADFSAGRTVAVQGWQLSATEAKLAGLVRATRR